MGFKVLKQLKKFKWFILCQYFKTKLTKREFSNIGKLFKNRYERDFVFRNSEGCLVVCWSSLSFSRLRHIRHLINISGFKCCLDLLNCFGEQAHPQSQHKMFIVRQQSLIGGTLSSPVQVTFPNIVRNKLPWCPAEWRYRY